LATNPALASRDPLSHPPLVLLLVLGHLSDCPLL
jgi:hypothetical protein